MSFILIDKIMLIKAISTNTDASELDAKHIINTVLLRQRKYHSVDCESDSYTKDVCTGMYADKCDAVISLCEALRAVMSLTGENHQVKKIVENAILEHG